MPNVLGCEGLPQYLHWHPVRLGANTVPVAQCYLQALCLAVHKKQDTFQPFARPPALLSLCPGPAQPRSVTDTLVSAY